MGNFPAILHLQACQGSLLLEGLTFLAQDFFELNSNFHMENIK